MQIYTKAVAEVSASEQVSTEDCGRKTRENINIESDTESGRQYENEAVTPEELEANIRWPDADEQVAWERSPRHTPHQGEMLKLCLSLRCLPSCLPKAACKKMIHQPQGREHPKA